MSNAEKATSNKWRVRRNWRKGWNWTKHHKMEKTKASINSRIGRNVKKVTKVKNLQTVEKMIKSGFICYFIS